ncbi:MAG: hypothetical protein O2955_04735 [Planctomycetota bacterium]|nr:hypothetical protein [Planctomycetota bacterium]MDA1211797.1 hypothetical protein [Planctomycetota bacterium]
MILIRLRRGGLQFLDAFHFCGMVTMVLPTIEPGKDLSYREDDGGDERLNEQCDLH